MEVIPAEQGKPLSRTGKSSLRPDAGFLIREAFEQRRQLRELLRQTRVLIQKIV
jgi:hypothetical protein